jgi:hypothetical protein
MSKTRNQVRIADHFALLEAMLGLATIIRAAEIESLQPDFGFALPFTMTAAGPIPARVRAREAEAHTGGPGMRFRS